MTQRLGPFALLLLFTPMAHATPALPYDSGVAGLLQRARLKGKTVVTHSTLNGGGTRVRTDVYVPRKGGLERYFTKVDGRHDNGHAFSATHFSSSAEHRVPVADVLRDLNHLVDGGPPHSASVWGSLRAMGNFARTIVTRSASTLETHTPEGAKAETTLRMKLSDGKIAILRDGALEVNGQPDPLSVLEKKLRKLTGSK